MKSFSHLFLFLLLYCNNSFALKCEKLFIGSRLTEAEESKAIDLLSRLESRFAHITNYIKFNAPTLKENPEVHRIRRMLDDHLDTITSGANNFSKVKDYNERIFRALEKFEKEVELLAGREITITFEKILENPLLIKTDRVYTISTPSGILRFSFSKEVVDAVFRDESPYRIRVANLFLQSLSHGFHTANNKGITKLTYNDNNMYELKIIGKAIGDERVAGYFIGNHFRIVFYSAHHMNTTQFMHSLVLRIKNDIPPK